MWHNMKCGNIKFKFFQRDKTWKFIILAGCLMKRTLISRHNEFLLLLPNFFAKKKKNLFAEKNEENWQKRWGKCSSNKNAFITSIKQNEQCHFHGEMVCNIKYLWEPRFEIRKEKINGKCQKGVCLKNQLLIFFLFSSYCKSRTKTNLWIKAEDACDCGGSWISSRILSEIQKRFSGTCLTRHDSYKVCFIKIFIHCLYFPLFTGTFQWWKGGFCFFFKKVNISIK